MELKPTVMEKFSMKEWKPETIVSKISRIEIEIGDLEEKKTPYVQRKREIESTLTEINTILKSQFLPKEEFSQININRSKIIREKSEIDIYLNETKKKVSKLHSDKEFLKNQLKTTSSDEIIEKLTQVRDKYQEFSSDSTRVSSTRIMASKFVEEIQSILKILQ